MPLPNLRNHAGFPDISLLNNGKWYHPDNKYYEGPLVVVMGISVSLSIILIKFKVDQMLQYPGFHHHIEARCWSLFYDFAFDFLLP